MGYNTKKILFDITSNTNPIPQYFGQLDDNFEPQLGIDGASLLSKGRAYQVGANATTTSIPILTFMGLGVSFTSSIQAKLVGSSFKTIIGSQYCEANVIAVSSSGTLTLDSALPSAPNSGTYFILEAPEQTQLAGSNALNAAVIQTSAANTATQLPNIMCREVTLIALKQNAGAVYVGGSGVSSTVYGVELNQKDSITFAVSNASMIYISTPNSGDGVSYVAL